MDVASYCLGLGAVILMVLIGWILILGDGRWP